MKGSEGENKAKRLRVTKVERELTTREGDEIKKLFLESQNLCLKVNERKAMKKIDWEIW